MHKRGQINMVDSCSYIRGSSTINWCSRCICFTANNNKLISPCCKVKITFYLQMLICLYVCVFVCFHSRVNATCACLFLLSFVSDIAILSVYGDTWSNLKHEYAFSMAIVIVNLFVKSVVTNTNIKQWNNSEKLYTHAHYLHFALTYEKLFDWCAGMI
jgi:hypothetical protein